MNATLTLSSSRLGRVLLHALCATRQPATLGWHWQGIWRELRHATDAPFEISPRPALRLAFGVGAAMVALMALAATRLAQGTYLSDPSNTNNRALVVAPGGNVGIGLLDPTAKLEVAGGGVRITGGELWTTDNWLAALKTTYLSSA